MNNKELEKIKKEYNDIKNILNSNFEEIIELENNPIVDRYNYLKRIQMLSNIGELNNDRSILTFCLVKSEIMEETNNIYVYMFENTIKRLETIYNRPILEPEENKNKKVIYYVDLENPSKYVFIPKEKQEEFENTNNVVYGDKNIYDAIDRYHNLRRKFFDLCICQNQEQEQAVKLLLQKYKRK